MKRQLTRWACGASLIAALATTGCQGSGERTQVQQDAKDRQILQLTEENHRLEQQLAQERAKSTALVSQQPRYDRAEAPAKTSPAPAARGATPPGRVTDLPAALRSKGVQAVTVDGQTALRIPGSSLFGSGQATLDASDQALVRELAAHLKKQYPSGRIRVDGHTDSDPIVKLRNRFKSNQELSDARAKAVRDGLVAGGLDRGRIEVSGHGADKPIASNKTADGKRQNRRVELVLLAD